MNHQYPPHDPFNPNPNPNPNPNFIPNFSLPPSHEFNVHTCLTSLQTLLTLSHSTLQSLSSLIPSLSAPSNFNHLSQCPSNPHHWVPQDHLFLHSLNCPSPIEVNVGTLQYPRTLKSEHQLNEQNKFIHTLEEPNSELCFSLDDYVDFGSNFFYQDCPGVVGLSGRDGTQGKNFTLPGVLSVECANFVSHRDRGNEGFEGNCVKVLPSELWFMRGEVEQWNDFPNVCSYSVLKALLCLECAKECDVSTWVIVNSPRFGVVIDVSMRDHVLVLVRLCLKAMFKEALRTYKSCFGGDRVVGLNAKFRSFECCVLVEVLRWLSAQLSILYGEANAKSFVVAMLKQLLPKAASRASFFPLDKETNQTPANQNLPGKINSEADESMLSRPIFVYQIAAAIAALHERSLLEARIKALRMPVPLTSYHRRVEHAHLSMKANEERQKRPDYRPLIEHDGLPLQRQHDQENNKMKTREELLAEERDYKRRRMSYRGKKLKRTAKEVMRDIIEEYTDAIVHAGGIGCLTQGDEGAVSTFKASPAHNFTNFKINHSISDQQDGHEIVAQNDRGFREARGVDASPTGYDQQIEARTHGRLGDRGPKGSRNEREHYSRSPSRDGRYGRSKEHRSHRRSRDITEKSVNERSKRNRSSSASSHRHHEYDQEYSTSGGLSLPFDRKDRKNLNSPERHRQRRRDYNESDSFRKDEFNDRYDPLNASDDEEDQYGDCKYARSRS